MVLTLGLSAQLTESSLELIVGTKTFESIASEVTKLRFNPFVKANVAFPIEMYIQDFGEIDSLNIQLAAFTAQNETNKNVHFNPINFNIGLYNPVSSTSYMTNNLESKLVIIEYVVVYENSNSNAIDTNSFQVIFDGEAQSISYNYDTNPDFFTTENEEFYIGMSLETEIEQEVIWFLNLTGDPKNPGTSETVEDFSLLNAIPQKNTLYTFSNLITSVGEEEISSNSRLEKTNSGYRLFSTIKDLNVELINTNGQIISNAKNYGSNYHFINAPNNLPSGIYFIKVSQSNGTFATYKAEF